MAYDAIKINLPAHKAGEDLTDKQYHFVKLKDVGEVDLCTDTTTPIGVLQNNPPYDATAGLEDNYEIAGSATITIFGITKVIAADEHISLGDYVASDADGKAIEGNANARAVGIALEASTAADQIISVLINTVTPVDRV